MDTTTQPKELTIIESQIKLILGQYGLYLAYTSSNSPSGLAAALTAGEWYEQIYKKVNA